MIDFFGGLLSIRLINSIKLCSRKSSLREYQDRVLGSKARPLISQIFHTPDISVDT